MPDDLMPSIFPRRWVPFLGPQQQIEEVVDTKVQQCGQYDPTIIPNCKATYFDEAHNKTIIVTFRDGGIWKTEARRPDKFELVILGDDNRVYRDGKPLPVGVIALAYSVERMSANP